MTQPDGSSWVSVTAQRVAAHRLSVHRLSAPYGDPGADERLARDVAAMTTVDTGSRMHAYLAARTAFFDRAVVSAVDAGMSQVVLAGAGYDGRPLRYAKPGVRWFELDHPGTQRDKRARLDRLGIDTSQVAFVPADFTRDDAATRLAAAGLDPSAPSLFACEGVVVYLERAVIFSLLTGLRRVAAAGSRLALSTSVSSAAPGFAARREAFRAAVGAVGEPARTVLTAAGTADLLSGTGWRASQPLPDDPRTARADRLGLVVAEPGP